LILLFGIGPILSLFFQNNFQHSVELIQIMSFLPLMVAWSNIYGMMTMTTFGYKKELSRIYVISGLISVATIIILTYFFHEKGTAVNALLIESLVTVLMFIFLKKKKIDVPKGMYGTKS